MAAARSNMLHAAAMFPKERVPLHAQLLALAANCLAKIQQLRLDRLGDGIARRVEIIPNLLLDVLDGNAIPEVATAIGNPPGAGCGLFTGPACSAANPRRGPLRSVHARGAGPLGAFARRPEHGHNRPRTTGSATEQHRGARTDDHTDQRCCEQVVLFLMLSPRCCGAA